ncbi:hypothetical protein CR956_00615 [Candidatus Saccharibacteria bacterium]|nr:MAG: hypothetical protein CR956_00615 [Candidatus Saccharibacteria bacterium]
MKTLNIDSKHVFNVSSFVYILLNIGLAVATLAIVLLFESPWIALAFVLASKWRIFSARPRFWVSNLMSNTVDIVVGLGHIVMLYSMSGAIWSQIVLTAVYMIWLVYIKPGSTKALIATQSLMAIFYGSTAIALSFYDINIVLFMLLLWGLGFFSARHYVVSYDNEDLSNILGLVWGFVFAELGFVGYHWIFAYILPIGGGFYLMQLALIMTSLSFMAGYFYDYTKNNAKVKLELIAGPILFTIALILVMILLFNKTPEGSIL